MNREFVAVLLIVGCITLVGWIGWSCWRGSDQSGEVTELLGRITQLEQALESSNQERQLYRQQALGSLTQAEDLQAVNQQLQLCQQQESEHLKQIAELQAAHQQLEKRHTRNLDRLFQ